MNTIKPPLGIKRRALVLTDETARHPFLAGLPPRLRSSPPRRLSGTVVERSGWRDILTAYTSMFTAVMVFIA